jgi:hypothetical protein
MKQPKIKFKEDKSDEWYWITIATNGKVLGKSSESYERLKEAKRGFNADTKARFTLLGVAIPDNVQRLGGDFLAAMPEDRIIIERFKK